MRRREHVMRASSVASIRGFSLLEFMLALLVFSIGLVGVRSTQLVARQVNNESLQHTLATLAVSELVSRIELNATHLHLYRDAVDAWGGSSETEALEGSCSSDECAVSRRVQQEVTQWFLSLSPPDTDAPQGAVVGLLAVFACIDARGPLVTVGVGWLSVGGNPEAERPGCTTPTGPDLAAETLAGGWNFIALRTLVTTS